MSKRNVAKLIPLAQMGLFLERFQEIDETGEYDGMLEGLAREFEPTVKTLMKWLAAMADPDNDEYDESHAEEFSELLASMQAVGAALRQKGIDDKTIGEG